MGRDGGDRADDRRERLAALLLIVLVPITVAAVRFTDAARSTPMNLGALALVSSWRRWMHATG